MMKNFSYLKVMMVAAIGFSIIPVAQAKDRHADHRDRGDRYNHHHSYSRTYYAPRYYSGYNRYEGYYGRPYFYSRPRTSISIGVGTGYSTNYYRDDDRPIYKGEQISQSRDASLEIAVQKKLSRLGYYDGEVDGDIGPASQRAILRFQRDNDLSTTGQIDRSLVAALGLS